MDSSSLRQRTIDNIAIVSSLQVVSKLVTLVRSILLARLLMPEDFAVLAIGGTLLNFFNQFSGAGISQAIVRKDRVDERTWEVAFTTNLVISAVIFLGVFFLAPSWGNLVHNPRAVTVTRLLGLVTVMAACSFLPSTRLLKEANFRQTLWPTLLPLAADTGVSLLLAWQGRGYWSLVAGIMASQVAAFLAFWHVAPFRFRLAWDRAIARDLFSYGKNVLGTSILLYISVNADDFLVQKYLGATALGFYVVAYRWGNFSTLEVIHVVSRVLFPTFSLIKDDPPRIRAAFLETLEHLAFIIFPLSLGFLSVAPEFVAGLLGSKWEPIILPLQILCVMGLARGLNALSGTLCHGLGRADILFWFALFWAAVIPPALVLVVPRYGLLGCCCVVAGSEVLGNVINFLRTRHLIHFTLGETLRCLQWPLLNSLLMASAISLLRPLLPWPPLTGLAALVAAGALIYLGGSLLFHRRELAFLGGFLREALRKVVVPGKIGTSELLKDPGMGDIPLPPGAPLASGPVAISVRQNHPPGSGPGLAPQTGLTTAKPRNYNLLSYNNMEKLCQWFQRRKFDLLLVLFLLYTVSLALATYSEIYDKGWFDWMILTR